MTAGRELDALVAEKVMELEVVWHGGNLFYKEQGKFHQYELLVPEYSSFMGEAWLVVEKMQCKGYDDKWFFLLEYDSVETWDCAFYKTSKCDGGSAEQWATATAAPLAICLAALKVKGVTL